MAMTREEFLAWYAETYGNPTPVSIVTDEFLSRFDTDGGPSYPENASEKLARLHRSAKNNDVPANSYVPDWSQQCSSCGASPVVPITGMCGPCTFGEAETIHGNW